MTQNLRSQSWNLPSEFEVVDTARVELEKLREIAIAIETNFLNAVINLEAPEPCLLYITVEIPRFCKLEIYPVVPRENESGLRFGIFGMQSSGDSIEHYEETVELVLEFIKTITTTY